MVARFFWVCAGGAIGSGARYLVAIAAASIFGAQYPWGTLIVNVVGSFALGGLMHVGATSDLLDPSLRLALATGLLGGFTTYSTFNYETLTLLQEGAWAMGLVNVLTTLTLCLVAGLGGIACGRWLVGG